MTFPASTVNGIWDGAFDPVRAALQDSLDTGDELGAALAIMVGDTLVADLWGGWQDAARTVEWSADTIVNLWSISKTITALAALQLVDSGALHLDLPVSYYWPAFGQSGKDSVLVRHVLSHGSGVPGWTPPFSLDDFYDPVVASRRLAEQPARWHPGSAPGYQAQNYGHLIGHLVQSTTGMGLGAFIDMEVAGPGGVDYRLGAGDVEDTRIAELVASPPAPMPFPSDLDRTVMADTFRSPVLSPREALTSRWRAAELGALNGHGNARALVELLRVLANDGYTGGRRVLSTQVVAEVYESMVSGRDRVLGLPIDWGLGFALASPSNPAAIPAGTRAYWGGWGGSMVIIDPQNHLTFAYTMNKMSTGIIGSARSAQYIKALYQCLPRYQMGIWDDLHNCAARSR
jgi:CubicO group peptidase (beta-lactamase class C family)